VCEKEDNEIIKGMFSRCSWYVVHLFYTYQCDVPLLSARAATPAIKKVRQFLFLINQSVRAYTHAREKNCRSWEIDAPVHRDFICRCRTWMRAASLAMKNAYWCAMSCMLSWMHILLRMQPLCNPFPCMCITPISIFYANEHLCRCSTVLCTGSIENFKKL